MNIFYLYCCIIYIVYRDLQQSFMCTVVRITSSSLPARASKQGNVIGSVHIYIYVCTKKNCN